MRFPSYQGRFYTAEPRARRGGQAEVYQATDDEGRRYAVKLALPGEEVGWLEEERALVEELLRRWPDLAEHVVPVVDAGEHEGRPFLVMPWEERRLDTWLREHPLEDRLLALTRLAESVSRLQYGPEGARGEVVHRDIKPSNVFVDERDGELRVRLSDFGAAGRRHRYAEAFLTGRHTEGFAPLDQILPRKVEHLDPSWDVYALATTVYHGLTGQPLHGVQQSYGELTVHGRSLKQAATDYERDPSGETYRQILALATLPLAELANLAAIQPLRAEDRAVLRSVLGAALADRIAEPERLAAWMCEELCQELERALAPDPARRSADARGLHDALARIREVLGKALRGERTFLDAPARWPWLLVGLAALGTGLALAALWPRPRDVALEVLGVPAWSTVRATLAGTAVEGATPRFLGLARGEHGLLLEGGLPGEDGRCAWRRELPVRVGPGIGVARLVVTLADPPRCPSAEAGYATVRIEPGTFWIGSTDDEWYREPDEVRREVTLTRPFDLGTTEITQAMWRAVAALDPTLPTDPMRTERTGPLEDGREGEPCSAYLGVPLLGDDLPVACVTWREALRFANALSAAEGLRPAYSDAGTWDPGADGWRLPTEAEWEVAARAGDRHALFAGSFHAEGDRACAELYRYANVADPAFGAAFPHLRALPIEAARLVDPRCPPGVLHDDGHAGLAPVASYQPNAWGLFDMSGNVREWAWDLYDPPAGARRSFRGSAFDDGALALRLADRGAGDPEKRYIYVGLRLARSW